MNDGRADYTFTVFTPTFNRRHTLPRVYESLRAQTFRDFEWLVVDDGSTDGTEAFVERCGREADFPVHYCYQDNQGKHIAVNHGVQLARGEFFLIADSDDAFVPSTLERFHYHWNCISTSERAHFCGIACLCADQAGGLVGEAFPRNEMDSDFLEMYYRFKVRGEKWWFVRTAVHRQYLFPETLKQTYVPEGLIWFRMGQAYQVRFVNEPLRIYYRETSGTSIMRSSTPATYAPGGSLLHELKLNETMRWFPHAPNEFCFSAIHYSRFSFHIGHSPRKQFRQLSNPLARLLWATFLPLGFAAFVKDRS